MKRIGLLGGTFNPVHIGHLMLADCAREDLALDEVWLIPTGYSYHKTVEQDSSLRMPDPPERMHMAELAVSGAPYFRVLDLEVKRGGNTYTYETLEQLRPLYPEHEFCLIIGADCLYSIEHWKYPERIFQNCQAAAAVRENADIDRMEEIIDRLRRKYGTRFTLLPFRSIQISSTEIRERIRTGKSVRYMLQESVASYIEEKGFYRDEAR